MTRRAFYVLKEVTDGKKFIVELMQATKRLVNDLLHGPECEKCSPKHAAAADNAADNANQMVRIYSLFVELGSQYVAANCIGKIPSLPVALDAVLKTVRKLSSNENILEREKSSQSQGSNPGQLGENATSVLCHPQDLHP